MYQIQDIFKYNEENELLKKYINLININIENKPYSSLFNNFLSQEYIFIENIKVSIIDDKWDISNRTLFGRKKSTYIFNFHKFENQINIILKLYLINRFLIFGTYFTGNKAYLKTANEYLCYLKMNKIDIENTDLDDIILFLDIYKKNKLSHYEKSKGRLVDFLKFYSLNFNVKINTKIFDFLDKRDVIGLKTEAKTAKYSLPSTTFMRSLITKLEDEAYSSNDTIDSILLTFLIIATQTGLRTNELLLLKKDSLIEVKYKDKSSYQLRYLTTKNRNIHINRECTTIATQTLVKAFKHLEKYYVENENNILVLQTIDGDDISRKLRNFCIKNSSSLNLLNNDKLNLDLRINTESGVIYYPSFKQFRVYFSTELANRGVNDILIAKMLGHEDPKMWGYYTRSPYELQEDSDYSKFKVEEIIVNGLKILGPRSDEYNKLIETFNIQSDVSINIDVIDTILTKIPIRQKLGGFCMKPNPNRVCSVDAETDELFCAYQMCPNQCHTVVDLPYYLNLFKNFQFIIKNNQVNGFINSAQKEIFKMNNLLNTKLIPEINELKRLYDVNKQFIDTNIELSRIHQNLINIEGEVEKWQNLHI